MKEAFRSAKKALEKAYAPYSQFFVGASVKAKSFNEIFTGTNIENASYGASVCAERVALWHMVHKLGGTQTVEWLCFVTKTKEPSRPCGQCLQVLSEFCDSETKIYCYTFDGMLKESLFKELFPEPFKLK